MARTTYSHALRRPLTAALALGLLACGDDGSPAETDASSSTSTDGTADTSAGPTTGPEDSSTTQDPDTTTGTTDTTADSSESGSSSSGEVVCDADVVVLPGDTYFPEGVASDAAGNLYVGSVATGAVVLADSCTGEVSELVPAGGLFTNPVGLIVDEANATLVVCNSDIAFAAPPSIDVIDLADGSLLGRHTFDAPGFCNDLTLDADGNAYATDSAGARVLRVAAADLPSMSPPETWATDPDFVVGMGEFGLNGITFDGEASIYVVNYAQGELHRIAIAGDGSAGAVTPIVLGAALAAPDGLEWADGDLLVIEGGLGAVSRIELNGDSGTVTVVADGYDVPTTLALVGSDAWVAEGQLDHLLGIDPNPPEPPFVVTRLPL